MTDFKLRALTHTDLDAALHLSLAAGWPHQRQDWAMLEEFGPGCLAIDGARPIGTACRSDFGADLSTLNMIIVADGMRRRGVAQRMLAHLMDDPARTYRLVATALGRPLYEKLGFRPVGRVIKCEGRVGDVPLSSDMTVAEAVDLPGLIAIENASFGADRALFVNWLLRSAQVVVTRSDSKVTGYAARRAFGAGYVIGPVVAQSECEARSLVCALAQGLKGHIVRLDIAETSGLLSWVRAIGIDPQTSGAVMQQGATVLRTGHRHALFSQALL